MLPENMFKSCVSVEGCWIRTDKRDINGLRRLMFSSLFLKRLLSMYSLKDVGTFLEEFGAMAASAMMIYRWKTASCIEWDKEDDYMELQYRGVSIYKCNFDNLCECLTFCCEMIFKYSDHRHLLDDVDAYEKAAQVLFDTVEHRILYSKTMEEFKNVG